MLHKYYIWNISKLFPRMNWVIFTFSKQKRKYIFLYSFANAEHKHVFWITEKKIYHLFPFILFALWLLAIWTSFFVE